MPLEPYRAYDPPHAPWKQAPLLRYALLLIVGIVLGNAGRQLLPLIVWGCITLGLALLSVAAACSGNRVKQVCGMSSKSASANNLSRKCAVPHGLTLLAVYATLVAVGATLTCLAYQRVEVCWPDTPQSWQAEVLNVREREAHTLRTDLRINAPHTPFHQKVVRAKLTLTDTALQIVPADRITFYAPIRPGYRAGNPGDFDYNHYLLTHGISGTTAPDSCWQLLAPNTHQQLSLLLLRYRQQLLDTYAQHFGNETLGILSALTLGDKSTLTANTRRLFSDTGTSHVLALSGLHLGILFSLLQLFILRWIRKRRLYLAAQAISLGALWLFVALAGSPLSLQRAAWMFSLFLLGNSLQRTHQATLNNLALAALILLVCSPLSLFDVGFQLSFTAVLSILIGNEYVWQRLPVPNWSNAYERMLFPAMLGDRPPHTPQWRRLQLVRLRLGVQKYAYLLLRRMLYPFICVSLSAQLGTAPLILYYFHTFSPYALVANLLVIPAAYALLGGALLFFAIPVTVFRTAIVEMLTRTVEMLTTALNWLSSWPGATIRLYPHVLTICLLTLLPLAAYQLVYRRCIQHRRRAWMLVTAMLLACIGIETYRLRPQRLAPQIIIYNLPRTTAIHFVQSAQCSYLFSPTPPDTLRQRMAYVEKNFFTPRSIAPPQPIGQTDLRNRHLLHKGNLFVFGTTRLLLLRHRLPKVPAQHPLPIEVLVVGYGSFDTPARVQQHVRPQQVVLDPTLPARRRNLWLTTCAAANIPCHDVRDEGAFIYPLN